RDAQRRVPGEVELFLDGEDPHRMRAVELRKDEGGLELAQLLCDRQELRGLERAIGKDDRQAISAQRAIREDVDVEVFHGRSQCATRLVYSRVPLITKGPARLNQMRGKAGASAACRLRWVKKLKCVASSRCQGTTPFGAPSGMA